MGFSLHDVCTLGGGVIKDPNLRTKRYFANRGVGSLWTSFMEASEALSWSLIHRTTRRSQTFRRRRRPRTHSSSPSPLRAAPVVTMISCARACAEGRADRERQRSRRVRDIPFMLFLPSFPFVPLLQTCMNFLKLDESVT